MTRRDHTELQAAIMRCAFCESLSAYVAHAMRPGERRRRTDATLFGVCKADRGTAEVWAEQEGYLSLVFVEWEGLGLFLQELENAGLVA